MNELEESLVKGCSFCYPNKVIYEDAMAWAIEVEPGHLILCPRKHMPFSFINLSLCGFLLNVPGLMKLEKFKIVVSVDCSSPMEHLHFHCYIEE